MNTQVYLNDKSSALNSFKMSNNHKSNNESRNEPNQILETSIIEDMDPKYNQLKIVSGSKSAKKSPNKQK